jgi:molybdopterin molybdotransferase
MITIDEALRLLRDHIHPLAPRDFPAADAVGRVLARDVSASVDSPPYDKALMDGYAVRAADVASLPQTLRVLEQVTAGQVPARSVESGTATRIMTGAPLPHGADAVVPIEMTDTDPAAVDVPSTVTIHAGSYSPGRHILRQAELMRAGEVVLPAGHRLRSVEVGLLAEMGHTEVSAFPRPSMAIIATGDELVPPGTQLRPGQIWNSNGALLQAAAQHMGLEFQNQGIVPDQPHQLASAVRTGLDCDVLLLTGGVSMGVHDHVPAVLRDAGVECLFHKVSLKPGKPIWCGIRQSDKGSTLVFGLPGNPVSTLVCFELFVRPALQRLAGLDLPLDRRQSGVLSEEFQQRGDRPTCYPGRAERDAQQRMIVAPLDWRGSADLRTLAQANCLIYFAAGTRTYPAQSVVSYYPIDI